MYMASIGNRTFWLPQEVIESEFYFTALE